MFYFITVSTQTLADIKQTQHIIKNKVCWNSAHSSVIKSYIYIFIIIETKKSFLMFKFAADLVGLSVALPVVEAILHASH